MVSEWIACLDKRPCERSGEDLDIIYSRLKTIKCFEKFHPLLLQQICYYGYYEDLERGVTLFRQGDIGTNWYTVLSGSLEVQISETGHLQDAMTLCTLGPGTSFGECILTNRPRHATIITCDYTELIRVEQKDFKVLWEVSVPLSSPTSSAGESSAIFQKTFSVSMATQIERECSNFLRNQLPYLSFLTLQCEHALESSQRDDSNA